MDRKTQDPPTPRDEISAIAGRIMAQARSAKLITTTSAYNELLADAKRLAAFVLRSDTEKGKNTPAKRKPRG